jgi:lipopolysaccharide/colanic/teichoic acid biosynthesis glycosyltransferase
VFENMSKRILDIIGSCVGLLLFSPLLISIAILVKATSPGPVFFIQDRIGLKGKHFRMFKFRSMLNNAEKQGTGLFSFDDDPRVTRIGHVLRRKSLDELPQLINVLLGQMSLVGPRPPVTYELGPWEDYTPAMRKRFDMKPGITGLAQVSGRNSLDWDEKVVFDNQYVDLYARYGVVVDLRILVQTIGVVLSGSNTVQVEKADNHEGEIATRAHAAGHIDSSSTSVGSENRK